MPGLSNETRDKLQAAINHDWGDPNGKYPAEYLRACAQWFASRIMRYGYTPAAAIPTRHRLRRACRQRRGARYSAVATYRFRLIDRHGQLIGVHYLSFDSDAEAIRHADKQ
jgi:hypothetical protein